MPVHRCSEKRLAVVSRWVIAWEICHPCNVHTAYKVLPTHMPATCSIHAICMHVHGVLTTYYATYTIPVTCLLHTIYVTKLPGATCVRDTHDWLVLWCWDWVTLVLVHGSGPNSLGSNGLAKLELCMKLFAWRRLLANTGDLVRWWCKNDHNAGCGRCVQLKIPPALLYACFDSHGSIWTNATTQCGACQLFVAESNLHRYTFDNGKCEMIDAFLSFANQRHARAHSNSCSSRTHLESNDQAKAAKCCGSRFD